MELLRVANPRSETGREQMKKDNGRTARRAQIRRILQIIERIQAGDYPNCMQMADEMKVSHKTIKRDLEFMRDELELPIEYDQSRRGFYYTRSPDKLFGLGISAANVRDLVEGTHLISEYLGTPLEKLIREAFQQMKQDLGLGNLPIDSFNGGLSFLPLAPVRVDMKALQIILGALGRRRALRFKYTGQGKEEERHGLPYHVSNINQCWYVFLYCLRDREVQLFPIFQMRAPCMTDKRFTGPKNFDRNKYLRGRFIVAGGKGDYKIVVELDGWATERMRYRQIPAMTDFIELPDRRSRVHLRLNTLEEIERWVLVLGTHATVLEPPALIKRLRDTTRELAEGYERMLSQGNVAS
jgi:predicted DNA-binding transcriptional regulator YafY